MRHVQSGAAGERGFDNETARWVRSMPAAPHGRPVGAGYSSGPGTLRGAHDEFDTAVRHR
ncbi:hypothetical protein SF06_07050 [Pseudomonas flexibilis]|nr:hypothetical protein SF06_07050 [Pseudomonas flexibilis]